MEEVQNEGMTQWTALELAQRVKQVQQGDPKKPVPVMETRNFVGQFISELDLRTFPLDYQVLRLTLMCNMTKDVTFSHKVPREMDRAKNPTREAKPMRLPDGSVICAIKCNLEADTLSEWDVLLQNGMTLEDDAVEIGRPALAVVKYEFKEHDKAFSAEGAIYQRLDFYVYVERELKNMMFSIILPTAFLSLSSLCVFSLDIEGDRGDRFGVLFTVILTIIANQFVTQGRLPYLAYFTWLDLVLLMLQFFVYAVVVETALCERISLATGMDIHQVDIIGMYVLIGLFALLTLITMATGYRAYAHRREQMKTAEADGKKSYENEEARLHRLWFPDEYDPNEVPVGTSGDDWVKRRNTSHKQKRRHTSSSGKVKKEVQDLLAPVSPSSTPPPPTPPPQ